MPDGTTSLLSPLWDMTKWLWLALAGLVAMNKSDIPSIDADTGLAKHIVDAAGVSVGSVALADATGVINWLDLINDYLQTGIFILTFIWMTYRIIEIRANIKAKRDG